MTYFDAQKNENERCIDYRWGTASEINNDYFEILVSKDGNSWNSISRIPGNGNSFVNKAAQDTLKIDICNECHPFFTGSERMVDTAGRIEKFNARYNKK